MTNFEKAVELIEKSDIESLKQLIKENPSILEEKDRDSRTILHHTVRIGDVNIVKLLLEYEVDVNSRDSLREPVLHYAIEKGNIDIVKLLVDRGADLYSRNFFNQTALHYAVRSGNIEIAKYLILKGLDLYIQDDIDTYPLDYIEDEKTRNELLFIYHNREKILEEMKRQNRKE